MDGLEAVGGACCRGVIGKSSSGSCSEGSELELESESSSMRAFFDMVTNCWSFNDLFIAINVLTQEPQG